MQNSSFALRRVTPWIVNGVSSIYALQRARRLSVADPDSASLLEFLASQSDVILFMVGGQVVWHLTARQRHMEIARLQALLQMPATTHALHQLREVFTVLTLGTGLLARRVAKGKTADIEVLIARLQKIASEGARLVIALDTAVPDPRTWDGYTPPNTSINGLARRRGSFPSA